MRQREREKGESETEREKRRVREIDLEELSAFTRLTLYKIFPYVSP